MVPPWGLLIAARQGGVSKGKRFSAAARTAIRAATLYGSRDLRFAGRTDPRVGPFQYVDRPIDRAAGPVARGLWSDAARGAELFMHGRQRDPQSPVFQDELRNITRVEVLLRHHHLLSCRPGNEPPGKGCATYKT